MENAGKRTVDLIYKDHLMVDAEWSVRTECGFTWWPNRFSQTIEYREGERGPDGEMGYLISVRTPVFRDIQIGRKTLGLLNSTVMMLASMSGPVFDESRKELALVSTVRVHDGVVDFLSPLISLSSMLQIAEADLAAEILSESGEGEVATGGHPVNGPREVPDEMAFAVENLIGPLGEDASRWVTSEFDRTVESYMQGPPALMATAGGPGLTVEFPYGQGSSLCTMSADQPHPIYGNGLLLHQKFPMDRVSEEEGSQLALQLNSAELVDGLAGYGFGSYCYLNGLMNFVAFFPNAAYSPSLLPNLFYGSAERARKMSIHLTGTDWDESSFDLRSRSVIGRLLERMAEKPD